jgi:hydroxyethylthiazole kinase-like uncharacterized protein yjeF
MIELLTTAEMSEADRLAIASGISGYALMQAAGRAVAEAAQRMLPAPGEVAVICGPGNNGGDGFVAARLLAEAGYRVRVLQVNGQEALKGDVAEAVRQWSGPTLPAAPAALGGAGLIVDALYGAGLSRPVEGLARSMIEAMNAGNAPVLAVDLPSGIQGTTGLVMGVAVQAEETVTFFRRKPAHLLLPGRVCCGLVTVANIGIGVEVLDQIHPNTFVNEPALWGADFPVPRVDGHKYSRGHAVVVSGGIASTGAARLAARGALRAGAGLVTIASPREALAVNAGANLAVMVRPADGAEELGELLADARLNAVLLGPCGGVGPAMREAVGVALKGGRSVVLDADALTSFAGASADLASALHAGGGHAVLTPHAGEFQRLFGDRADIIDGASKLERARAAAAAMGAIVLLKGADTVVAAPDGRAAISDNAPPWLGTAGSGDVLAGIIAGLLAQGMPAFAAACAGAWLHGEAGAAAGPGLISEDLPDVLPKIYGRLFAALPQPSRRLPSTSS